MSDNGQLPKRVFPSGAHNPARDGGPSRIWLLPSPSLCSLISSPLCLLFSNMPSSLLHPGGRTWLFSLPRIFFLHSSTHLLGLTALRSPLRTSWFPFVYNPVEPKVFLHTAYLYSTINNHLCTHIYLSIMFSHMAFSVLGGGRGNVDHCLAHNWCVKR